jgi:PPP family 3-phenylpropionic acid transporter
LTPERIGRSLRLYYFFYFGAIGILEPYLTLYFRHLGLSGSEIGILAGIPGLIFALFPFLWTLWADTRHCRRTVFLLNTWATPVAFLLLFAGKSFGLLFFASLLFAAFRSPLIPFLNTYSLQYGKERGIDFARFRVWGSLGYIVAAIGCGQLIDISSPRAALYGILVCLLLCGISWGKGLEEKEGKERIRKWNWSGLRGERKLLLLLLVGLLTWMSWAPYSNFFTIHLEGLGISKGWAGLAWALGVSSEVGLMFAWPALSSRFRSQDLLSVGLFLVASRWLLYSIVRGPGAILSLQLLHGITFACFYLSSMALLEEVVPPVLRASGQGVYSAVTFGLGNLLGGPLSGILFDRLGMVVLFRVASLLALMALILHEWSSRVRPCKP